MEAERAAAKRAAEVAAQRLEDEGRHGASREAALQACLDRLTAECAAMSQQRTAEQEDIGRRLEEAQKVLLGAQDLLTAGQARVAGLERSLADREEEMRQLQGRLTALEECVTDGERRMQEQCGMMEAAGRDLLESLGRAEIGMVETKERWAGSQRALEQQLAERMAWLGDWRDQVEGRCGDMEAGLAQLEGELARVRREEEDWLRRRAAAEADHLAAVGRLEAELAAAKTLLEEEKVKFEQDRIQALNRESSLRSDLEERIEYVDSMSRSQLAQQAADFASLEATLKAALAQSVAAAESSKGTLSELLRRQELESLALESEREQATAVAHALEHLCCRLEGTLDALFAAAAQAQSRQAAAAAATAKLEVEVSVLTVAVGKAEEEARAAAQSRDEARTAAERAEAEARASSERAELAADGRIGELLDEIAEMQAAGRRTEARAAVEAKRAAEAEAAAKAAEVALKVAEAGRAAAEAATKAAEAERSAAAAAAAKAEVSADRRIGELLAETDDLRRRLTEGAERERELQARVEDLTESGRRVRPAFSYRVGPGGCSPRSGRGGSRWLSEVLELGSLIQVPGSNVAV